MAIDRKDLHDLIDEIAPEDVDTIRKILKALSSQRSYGGWEFDDSPLTKEEAQAVAEAKAEIKRGEVSDWEDVKRELGL